MPTTYTDQFYTFDPANPPEVGTAVTFETYDLIDFDDDAEVDAPSGDSVNGSDVTSSWPGDVVTIQVPGVGDVSYTGITFYLANGQRVFTPTDGGVLQNGTFAGSSFVSDQGPLDIGGGELGPPCFTPGTLIATPSGDVAVELLAVGDLVQTLDHGPQRIRWIGQRTVSGRGEFAPVRIATGALGNRRTLVVSPQHRFLVTDWRSELLLGESQTLIAAKHLVDDERIRVNPQAEVTYIHLMCDRHEIIFADGAACESFDGHGDFARTDPAVAREIRAIFADAPLRNPPAARPIVKGYEGQLLSASDV